MPDTEKAAEAHDRIADLAGLLGDHYSVDCADLLAIGTIDVGAFDLVAADQRCGLASLYGCCRHDLLLDVSVYCSPVCLTGGPASSSAITGTASKMSRSAGSVAKELATPRGDKSK